jgi:thymidylate synthase
MIDHGAIFRQIYRDVKERGQLVAPRGQTVLEIEDYSYVLPPFVRFQSFVSRKLNLNYIKDEMLWYIKGDRYDTSIASKAKIWQGIINRDGTINSNYGQYIFAGPKQFDNVVRILTEDRDSRRASIMILNDNHLLSDTKDVPCTYGINFRIRNDKLNMSVMMRSQDAIFGMANDCPAFSFIHEMMLNALRRQYPTLDYGTYHHTANSFHIYERHFAMLDRLVADDPYVPVDCPKISGPDEVAFLRALDFSAIPQQFAFAKWLTER